MLTLDSAGVAHQVRNRGIASSSESYLTHRIRSSMVVYRPVPLRGVASRSIRIRMPFCAASYRPLTSRSKTAEHEQSTQAEEESDGCRRGPFPRAWAAVLRPPFVGAGTRKLQLRTSSPPTPEAWPPARWRCARTPVTPPGPSSTSRPSWPKPWPVRGSGRTLRLCIALVAPNSVACRNQFSASSTRPDFSR